MPRSIFCIRATILAVAGQILARQEIGPGSIQNRDGRGTSGTTLFCLCAFVCVCVGGGVFRSSSPLRALTQPQSTFLTRKPTHDVERGRA